MFRNLIPALADRYHVIAPDYPGSARAARRIVSDAVFLFLLASIIVLIFGPGTFSVDAVLKPIAPRATQEGATVTASPLAEGHHGKLRVCRGPSTHSARARAPG